jgi:hypothetical protein
MKKIREAKAKVFSAGFSINWIKNWKKRQSRVNAAAIAAMIRINHAANSDRSADIFSFAAGS